MYNSLHSTSCKLLRQPLSKDNPIVDRSQKTSHINQAGQAMDPPKPLIQSHHLLRMGGRIIALLPVAGFCPN